MLSKNKARFKGGIFKKKSEILLKLRYVIALQKDSKIEKITSN